jgi:hypothetical protein
MCRANVAPADAADDPRLHANHGFIARLGAAAPGRCSFIADTVFGIPPSRWPEYECGQLAAYTITISREAWIEPDGREADLCVEHTAHARACSTCNPVAVRSIGTEVV